MMEVTIWGALTMENIVELEQCFIAMANNIMEIF